MNSACAWPNRPTIGDVAPIRMFRAVSPGFYVILNAPSLLAIVLTLLTVATCNARDSSLVPILVGAKGPWCPASCAHPPHFTGNFTASAPQLHFGVVLLHRCVLNLVCLAPDIVEASVGGREPSACVKLEVYTVYTH